MFKPKNQTTRYVKLNYVVWPCGCIFDKEYLAHRHLREQMDCCKTFEQNGKHIRVYHTKGMTADYTIVEKDKCRVCRKDPLWFFFKRNPLTNKYRLKDSCKIIADAEFEDRAEKFEEYCAPIVEEDEWDKL